MTRILIDMDGPSANWSGGVENYFDFNELDRKALDWSRWDGIAANAPAAAKGWVKKAQASPDFYFNLRRVKGVRQAVKEMVAAGHDVRFCSTPDTLNSTCADDKIAWLESYIGEGWGSRLILTHDKTLVRGDILIDDKPLITGAMQPEWEHIVWDAPYNGPDDTDLRFRLFAWADWVGVVNFFIAERAQATKAAITTTISPQVVVSPSGEIRTVSSTGGEKGTKPQRYDLVPVLGMDLLAELYANGAAKYSAHNWRRGYAWSNSYAAAMRHMTRFWAGEDIDPEMQIPHPIAAVFHMFALVQFMQDFPEFDDRYTSEGAQA